MGFRVLIGGSATGRFITLEGGEGAGKTTLAHGLVARLARSGVPVLRTREPGGSRGAEAVRRLLLGAESPDWDPMTEAMMMSAARREHVVATVAPMLAAGAWVVCDRFVDSTMAYQGTAGRVGPDACTVLTALAVGLVRPDLTLVLDVPVAAGLDRARRRGDINRFDARDEEFHARVREAFLSIAAAEPARCAVLDAARPAADVLRDAWSQVGSRLGTVPGPGR